MTIKDVVYTMNNVRGDMPYIKTGDLFVEDTRSEVWKSLGRELHHDILCIVGENTEDETDVQHFGGVGAHAPLLFVVKPKEKT